MPTGMGTASTNGTATVSTSVSGNAVASASTSASTGSAPYSSVADDKTLHESYLWSFYDGVKEGLGAVM